MCGRTEVGNGGYGTAAFPYVRGFFFCAYHVRIHIWKTWVVGLAVCSDNSIIKRCDASLKYLQEEFNEQGQYVEAVQ